MEVKLSYQRRGGVLSERRVVEGIRNMETSKALQKIKSEKCVSKREFPKKFLKRWRGNHGKLSEDI